MLETPHSPQTSVDDLCRRARSASRSAVRFDAADRRRALLTAAEAVAGARSDVTTANALDVDRARGSDRPAAFIDRLELTPDRFDAMVRGVREIADQPDPVGVTREKRELEPGLHLERRSVPLGVVAVIFESRPNVTVDAAAIGLKSGNAIILRGGSEAAGTNRALAQAMRGGLDAAGYPADAVQLLDGGGHEAVHDLLGRTDAIDLVIPRGGPNLIRAVVEHARMPVLKHYEGICHVYLDAAADPRRARDIVLNAKCDRPGVCNAAETLLVHADLVDSLLPPLLTELVAAGVEIRGDDACRRVFPDARAATDADWAAEYLDLILAVRIVPDLETAVDHIARFGSGHSEAIVTEDADAAEAFLRDVDAAAVYHNASTRYTDGAMFGLGAEIGISTDKLHARGPCGAEALTSYKYVVRGRGHARGGRT